MGNYWGAIEKGYTEYVDRYPQDGMLQVGADYPFQAGVNQNTQSFFGYNQGNLERKYLVSNRGDIPSISQLPRDDLAQMPLGLTRILKIQLTPDHDTFWKVVAEWLSDLNEDNDPLHDPLVRNIELLVHALIGGSWIPPSFWPSERSPQSSEDYILSEAAILARYMAYPTLEGIIKSLCRRDIRMDGKVRTGRIVLKYGPIDHYPGGERCNNVGHLLWHLEQEVADTELQSRMYMFREAYADFFDNVQTDRVYGDITAGRNTSLHGEKRGRAEFGMLLNLISLIVLNVDHIPEEYRRVP